MRNVIVPSLAYFLLVFLAGFVLGTFRVLVLVPAVGERYAELLEMPVMVVVSALAAGFVVRRFRVSGLSESLGIGGIALLILVAFELTLVLGLRGLSIAQYIAERDPVAGGAYLLSLVLFALFPALLGPARHRRSNQ